MCHDTVIAVSPPGRSRFWNQGTVEKTPPTGRGEAGWDHVGILENDKDPVGSYPKKKPNKK